MGYKEYLNEAKGSKIKLPTFEEYVEAITNNVKKDPNKFTRQFITKRLSEYIATSVRMIQTNEKFIEDSEKAKDQISLVSDYGTASGKQKAVKAVRMINKDIKEAEQSAREHEESIQMFNRLQTMVNKGEFHK